MNFLGKLLVFVVFAAVLLAAWWAIPEIINLLRGINSKNTGTLATALVALIGILYAQRNLKSRDIAEAHRPAKIEVYNTFLDIVEQFMDDTGGEKHGLDDGELSEELKKQFTNLTRGLITWASPSVVKAWSDFRKGTGDSNPDTNVLLLADDVLQAMRKDLGNSNFGLHRGDIVKLYLSNPEEVGEIKNGSGSI